MAFVIFQGFYDALAGGLLETTPDVRVKLVMPGTTCDTEEDAQTLSAFTAIDEFDGVGYAELNTACTTAYDTATDQWNLDLADGDFGNPVAPGSDVIQGMLVYLWVDGTDANDVPLGYSDSGGFGVNANNGALDIAFPAAGILFARSA